MAKDRLYRVTFRELAVVTEFISAPTAKEAIERIKCGEGERNSMDIDEMRGPFRFAVEVIKE